MIRFFRWHAILYAFLGAVLLALVMGIAKNMYQQYALHAQTSQMQAAVEQLQKANQNIFRLIEAFQQDSTVELEGRKDLNLQKPGEQTVIIIPPKTYPKDRVSAPEAPISSARLPINAEERFSGQFIRRAQLWWRFLFP